MRPWRPAAFIARSSKLVCECVCGDRRSASGRQLHTTRVLSKSRNRFRNLTQADIDKITKSRAEKYKAYTEAEKAQVAKVYTPEQLKAIELAEAAIPSTDLATQAQPRKDYFTPRYFDDFARIEPTVDKRLSKIRGEGEDYENVLDFAKVPTPEELMKKMALEPSKAFVDPNYNGLEAMLEDMDEKEIREAWSRFIGKDLKEDSTVLSDLREQLERQPDKFYKNPSWYQAFFLASDIGKQQGPSEGEGSDEGGDVEGAELAAQRPDPSAALEGLHGKPISEIAADAAKRGGPKARAATLQDKIGYVLDEWKIHPDPPDVAPEIPRIHDPNVEWEDAAENDEDAADDDTAVAYARLAKVLDRPLNEIKAIRTRRLVVRSVTNQTKLGKIQSSSILCIAGDGNGMLGLGMGKAIEAEEALRLASINAIRNMKPIRRYENRTIFGEVSAHVGAVELTLRARPPGFGLRVSQHVFEIARAAGLQDLSARITRRGSKMNVCKAVVEALHSQQDPEEVAKGRGKKALRISLINVPSIAVVTDAASEGSMISQHVRKTAPTFRRLCGSVAISAGQRPTSSVELFLLRFARDTANDSFKLGCEFSASLRPAMHHVEPQVPAGIGVGAGDCALIGASRSGSACGRNRFNSFVVGALAPSSAAVSNTSMQGGIHR
ncbi:hypothetical protein MRB53_037162 [Persea americana]|nr:hypothetical protein MRB53_037162 [Persea americana]